MPPLSLIIPTLNEARYLPRLLDSIARQKTTTAYEVVIVDGGSDDETIVLAEQYATSWPQLNITLHRTQRGVSHQRNVGATKALYDQLVFVDADAELSPGTLEKLARHYAQRKNFVAVPLLLPYDGKKIDVVLGALSYVFFVLVSHWNPIISGMCIIATRDAHERINGFNEKAIYGEDVDYGLRAFRSGSRYHIFFDVLVRASARRANRDGRLHVGLAWSRWYWRTIKHGPVTEADPRYTFGDFR